MNVIFQALLNTSPLVQYFHQGDFHNNLDADSDEDYSIAEAFSELAEFYWKGTFDFIRPGYLASLIWDA